MEKVLEIYKLFSKSALTKRKHLFTKTHLANFCLPNTQVDFHPNSELFFVFLPFFVIFFLAKLYICILLDKELVGMKVLIINGSPHKNGCGRGVISIISSELERQGISTEIYSVGDFSGGGCSACGGCKSGGGCTLGDLERLSEGFRTADGLIVTSPVYYGSPNGAVIALLDRLFQSSNFDKRMKVGAAFVTARRGGCTASFDVINKYFAISEMPIATSSYWNLMHTKGDKEGEDTALTLAKNMSFLIKCIAIGKEMLE